MDINRSTVRNLTKQFLDSPNATNSQDDLNSLHVSAISTTYREKKQPKLNQDQIPGIKTATILRKSEPKPTMSNRISIFGPSSDYFSDCSYDLKRSLSDSSLYKHGIKFLHSRDNRLNERGGPIHDQKKQIKSEMRDSCIISGIGNGFDEQSSMFQKQKLNSSESTRNLFRSTSVISNKNEQFDCKRIFWVVIFWLRVKNFFSFKLWMSRRKWSSRTTSSTHTCRRKTNARNRFWDSSTRSFCISWCMKNVWERNTRNKRTGCMFLKSSATSSLKKGPVWWVSKLFFGNRCVLNSC